MQLDRRSLMIGMMGLSAGCGAFPGADAGGSVRRDGSAGADHRSPAKGIGPVLPYAKPGFHRLEYDFEGQTRNGAILVPEGYDRAKPAPLVLGLHGGGGDWQAMSKEYGWGRICDARGWLGVFPNVGARHNTRDAPQDGDHDFIVDFLKTAMRDLPTDRRRLYAVGFSNGCRKTYRLAARESELFTAIGVVGGKVGEREGPQDWDPRATKAKRVSILHIHGERDAKVPMDGRPTPPDNRAFPPTLDGLRMWAEHNGAGEAGEAPLPEPCPKRVWQKRWVAASGHEVQGLFDPELEHGWPGWANAVILDFFKRVPFRAT